MMGTIRKATSPSPWRIVTGIRRSRVDRSGCAPAVRVPVDGVLDLHTFQPREIASLLDDYLMACLDRGIGSVRIIHGKGRGILRQRVWAILKRHPAVASFRPAPPEAGGWGATLAELAPPDPESIFH